MKKTILFLFALMLTASVLAGCAAGNANTMGATKAPAVTFTPDTATAAPAATAQPTTSAAPVMTLAPTIAPAGGSAAAMTPADAGRLAERIAEAVERISEIDDAEVVVSDDRVLVAVEFEDQYRAGLDERMKKMITDTVKKVDDGLTDIRITDDGTLYGQAKSLAQRVGKATGLDELADDFAGLWDRITGYGK